jgi:predicted small secreted protein
MTKRVATLAIMATCLLIAACNTIRGLKEDGKSVGDTFSNMTE